MLIQIGSFCREVKGDHYSPILVYKQMNNRGTNSSNKLLHVFIKHQCALRHHICHFMSFKIPTNLFSVSMSLGMKRRRSRMFTTILKSV